MSRLVLLIEVMNRNYSGVHYERTLLIVLRNEVIFIFHINDHYWFGVD